MSFNLTRVDFKSNNFISIAKDSLDEIQIRMRNYLLIRFKRASNKSCPIKTDCRNKFSMILKTLYRQIWTGLARSYIQIVAAIRFDASFLDIVLFLNSPIQLLSAFLITIHPLREPERLGTKHEIERPNSGNFSRDILLKLTRNRKTWNGGLAWSVFTV